MPALALIAIVVGVGLLFPTKAAVAFDPGNWIIVAIADVLLFFASLIGNITLTLIGLLVDVAQFNNFIDAPAVARGWVIVRDVCNMFFIVILLLIAFGSVFHIEEYQYKKILGKLLIMAVLINFSKSIAGFFIDISQVVMLTFVNGFHEAAAGNFLNGFHISEMFTFAEKEGGTAGKPVKMNQTSYLGAAALALVTIIITTIVVAVYLVVFLLRIIALWFLVIISPIAYALSAFPGDAKKYSSMWWDYFGKYATTGPILAFFLWLSLAVMQTTDNVLDYGFVTTGKSRSLINVPAGTITQIGQADILLSFIVNIMLLMGGLWMTQQLGVAGGKLAASASNKIQGAGVAIAKSPWSATKSVAKSVNQSIVKATGGRVSFDPRDYAQAYKTAKEKRRTEAYQDFFGRKQKFFKQWATPTGAVRGIVGAIPRAFSKGKSKDSDKEIKEIQKKIDHGDLGETYQRELDKERGVLDDNLQRVTTDKKNSTGPQRVELEQEEAEIRDKIAENDKISALPLDDLAKEYRIKLEDSIKQIQAERTKREAIVNSGSSDDVINARKDEITSDIDLINRDIEHNSDYSALLVALRDDKLSDNKTFKTSDIDIKLTDVKAELKGGINSKGVPIQGVEKRLDDAKVAAKISGDYSEVNKLEKQKANLTSQYNLLDKVQKPYAETKKNINDTEEELKKNRTDQKTAKGDDLNKLKVEEKELEAKKKAHEEEAKKSKGEPVQINQVIAEVEKNIGDLTKEKTVKEQEKNSFEKTRPEDKETVAEAIKEGWKKLIAQNKKKEEKMRIDIDMKDYSRKERAELTQQKKDVQKKIDAVQSSWYQTKEPAEYFVEQERRRNVVEEKKLITTKNSEELTSEFKKAVSAKNSARAKALMVKLTEDANLNELMNAYEKKSNFEGLNEFREEVLQGQLGLGEQEALQFQNDVSYTAEGVGHWASARTVGYNVTQGKYYAMDEEEHTKTALAEIMKMQPRQIVSSLNRLAYGGEVQNAEGRRSFEIDKLGEAIVIAAQNVIAKEIGHMQVNVATNLSDPRSMVALRELVRQGKIESNILRQIQSRTAQGAEKTPNDLVDYLLKGIKK
ncbi:MAG: hypothetical protein UX39_C0030G0002 [Candidatus Magasanikbacteria bacterium GW2011_GWA2_46_17]|uniref:Uncharacterized protein n=1 Tax=Candidatus Magasanikbacteria bacterium GW2011_GWA2_46_17 TaxID=1619042 RepID=A0A0G1NXI0_9BACT|nr:MAG: hypothetical protein UX39_C0030G0002 [Candidatus Magasanikbacteria bacterium GW2011_GWA2_46_17]